DGELDRGEREAEIRIRELRAQTLTTGEHDRLMVERELREAVDRVPLGVVRELGIDVARNESEVGGRQLPLLRGPVGVAQRLRLLEMRELAHVDLLREMSADRSLEGLALR